MPSKAKRVHVIPRHVCLCPAFIGTQVPILGSQTHASVWLLVLGSQARASVPSFDQNLVSHTCITRLSWLHHLSSPVAVFFKAHLITTPSTAIYKLLFVLSAFHYDDNWFMSKFNVVLSGILNHSDSSPANRSISAFTVSVPANQRCVKLGRILHVWQTCKKVVVNESPRAWDNILSTLNRSNQACCISLKVICLLRESCAP